MKKDEIEEDTEICSEYEEGIEEDEEVGRFYGWREHKLEGERLDCLWHLVFIPLILKFFKIPLTLKS